MIISVIPVKGRGLLVRHTVRRLLEMNVKVIAVLEKAFEKEFFKGLDVECTVTSGYGVPLGRKWNAGFLTAKNYNPEHILFVGSSDWVTPNWLGVMLPHSQKYDIVGVQDFYLAHIEVDVKYDSGQAYKREDVNNNIKEIKVGYWSGYKCDRKAEPIGIGRVLNRDFLERIDYQPFDDKMTRGMDHLMFNKAKEVGILKCGDHKCLSISTNLWPNMHDFGERNKTLTKKFLNDNFPEVLTLF